MSHPMCYLGRSEDVDGVRHRYGVRYDEKHMLGRHFSGEGRKSEDTHGIDTANGALDDEENLAA